MMQEGKPVCECVQGYSGQFCQDKATSSVPIVLTVLFIIGLIIVAAVVLKWRYVFSVKLIHSLTLLCTFKAMIS